MTTNDHKKRGGEKTKIYLDEKSKSRHNIRVCKKMFFLNLIKKSKNLSLKKLKIRN